MHWLEFEYFDFYRISMYAVRAARTTCNELKIRDFSSCDAFLAIFARSQTCDSCLGARSRDLSVAAITVSLPAATCALSGLTFLDVKWRPLQRSARPRSSFTPRALIPADIPGGERNGRAINPPLPSCRVAAELTL